MIASIHSVEGQIDKMKATMDDAGLVHYQLPLDDQLIELNELIGRQIDMEYKGMINCMHCQRPTKKSFSQGFCYPCMQRLAQCDICIMQPERCHYDQGTCREPEWGESHCLIDHIVYLANSSGLKVGITRHSQVPTRWIDQGAIQALPIARVSQRKLSGLIEQHLKGWISDKTNWRTMLKGEVETMDLQQQWQQLKPHLSEVIEQLQQQYGIQTIQLLNDDANTIHHSLWSADYPVDVYPTKVVSKGFDKQPQITGELQGIKGQYLILDNAVVNMRKHRGYHIRFSFSA